MASPAWPRLRPELIHPPASPKSVSQIFFPPPILSESSGLQQQWIGNDTQIASLPPEHEHFNSSTTLLLCSQSYFRFGFVRVVPSRTLSPIFFFLSSHLHAPALPLHHSSLRLCVSRSKNVMNGSKVVVSKNGRKSRL